MITAFLVLARTLHIGSALLMAGLLYSRNFILKPEVDRFLSRLIIRWLIGVWTIEVVSGALWFWIATAQMNDMSLLGVLDFSLIKTVWKQTQFGQLWQCRLAVAAVLGVIFFGPLRSSSRTGGLAFWPWSAFGLSALLLVSLAWAGHAASGTHYRAFHLSIDVFHLAVTAIWPVGLVPLAIFLFTLPKMNQASEGEWVIPVLHRFSDTSLVAVLLLFLTGLANAWLIVPSLSALFASNYGWLLLVKMTLFLMMVGFGAWNRVCYLPQLATGDPKSRAFRAIRKNVLIENILGLIVLFIVGGMGMTLPPQPPN